MRTRVFKLSTNLTSEQIVKRTDAVIVMQIAAVGEGVVARSRNLLVVGDKSGWEPIVCHALRN